MSIKMSTKEHWQKVMDNLAQHIGKKITIQFTKYKKVHTVTELLKTVIPFTSIITVGKEDDLNSESFINYPFIGINTSIQKITSADGKTLYENSLVHDGFNTSIEIDNTDATNLQKVKASEECAEIIRKMIFQDY